jgi:aspartyl-tRNA(Asn)/glutamyl-tRNA(Gln) amidotransferase subunit C
MPRVTAQTVDHVARLARLSLTDDERTLFARQLDEILDWAESLQSLPVDDVPPMTHALAVSAWRADEARQGTPRDQALAGAPDPAEGLFRVPRVIGG